MVTTYLLGGFWSNKKILNQTSLQLVKYFILRLYFMYTYELINKVYI